MGLRVLLTGNRGFIGSHLQQSLESKNIEVYGIDLKDNKDLIDCYLPPEEDFDAVIHLAGIGGVRESIENPTKYFRNNIETTRRLFAEYKNTHIVMASSSTAYEPYLNPYAASKFLCEQIPHKKACFMRIHTTYSNTPRSGMFFDKLINGTLTYTTTHHRDFIHVNDVVSAIETLMTNKTKGVLDVGTGHSVKICNLVKGYPTKPGFPYEREKTKANITKLKKLGWSPTIKVEDFVKTINVQPVDNNTKAW
jgi:nucleoside-diphosphate-sugar epimerase